MGPTDFVIHRLTVPFNPAPFVSYDFQFYELAKSELRLTNYLRQNYNCSGMEQGIAQSNTVLGLAIQGLLDGLLFGVDYADFSQPIEMKVLGGTKGVLAFIQGVKADPYTWQAVGHIAIGDPDYPDALEDKFTPDPTRELFAIGGGLDFSSEFILSAGVEVTDAIKNYFPNCFNPVSEAKIHNLNNTSLTFTTITENCCCE